MKVMVGGTFDPIHDGHRKLLHRAFALAGDEGTVVIGLTTDEFARAKSHPVRTYEARKQNLLRLIQESDVCAAWSIEPLNDRFGPAVTEDFDALVVSEGTREGAREVNRIRQERGLSKVDIHQIACVLAEDGHWISSTRILRGEIDRHGRLIR
jgi:pantetheine-phosphate adenylyltransferase